MINKAINDLCKRLKSECMRFGRWWTF